MTATTTPAEISTEVTEAQQAHYEPTLHLDEIHPPPRNIRHDAAADDELVASIAEVGVLEPLIVAPADDGYILIAGHRRLDGCRKAGRTSAPALVRLDLTDEADQVAAMLVENGRRKDLSPLEEAEGYGQLRFDFGWKPGAIAKAAGHNVDTINKRLKLLKLDTKVQKTLDEGQLTIEDAIAISELPKAEQTKVTKTAGTGSFKWELSQAKERVKRQAATDALIEKLEAAGVSKRDMPSATSAWLLNHADHGMTHLPQTFSRDRDDHPDCLAYLVVKSYDGTSSVEYVCTNVPAHDQQLDEKRRAERQAAEAEQRAADERKTAARIARQLRIDAITSGIKPLAKVDPAVARLLRVLAHRLLLDLDYNPDAADIYFDTLAIAEDMRWGVARLWTEDDRQRFRAHVDSQLNGSPASLLRTFAALAAAHIEGVNVADADVDAKARTLQPRESLNVVAAWLALAEESGHTLTPVDLELRDLATGAGVNDEAAS